MTIESFHPLVARWFRHRFAGPTAVQRRGWEAIAAGRSALLTAPTGSGKTLAAFLVCIDRLIRDGLAGRLDEAPRIVYVSPLKALSNDVHQNLQEPLREIADLAAAEGIAFPDIRVAIRTGDTPAAERQAMARRPPHIWITTPESLFILLTSESGRRGLQATGTIIVDEIHAIAGDKRGAHLALSLERLAALCERPLVRIGLSATVCPIEEVARLLVGSTAVDAAVRPDCDIIDEGHKRDLDLALELPRDELGPIATHELWDETIDRVAALSGSHRTTLVFVNTRRLVERVTHKLSSGPLGEGAVVAHRGSLSRATRLRAEERLKNGEAKICVATASLELGIDIGTVDLVCQLGSPRSVSLFLHRAGRAGPASGRTPKGRLFPLTRDELVECAALLRLIARGEVDRLRLPDWPLDILAQQVVAAAACDPLNLAGIVVPGPRVPAVSGNRVVLENGVPVGSRQAEGRVTLRPDVDPASAERARALLQRSA